MKKDTLTKKEVASLIKYHHPEYNLKDIRAILDAEAEVYEYGLDTGQRIKIGKLFFIEPVIRKGSRHYSGLARDGQPEYVELPERLRFKFRPLKRLKDIENSYHPLNK